MPLFQEGAIYEIVPLQKERLPQARQTFIALFSTLCYGRNSFTLCCWLSVLTRSSS